MKIEFCNGLLFVSLTLEYRGRIAIANNIILDTGAAQSLIDREAVKALDLEHDDDDIIVPMTGIGGTDYALRKQIDGLQFGSYRMDKPYVDFTNMDAHPGINGLLGTDVLVPGQFVIDVDAMEVYQKGIR